MSWLFRILPYWRWIAGALAIVSLVGMGAYTRHAWIEKEIAQRAYQQATQQLEAVTNDLEQERKRQEKDRKRIEKATDEAGDIDDSKAPAPDSVKHLLNELYGD